MQVRGEDRQRSPEARRPRGRAREEVARVSRRRSPSSGCGAWARRPPRSCATPVSRRSAISADADPRASRLLGTWGIEAQALARGIDPSAPWIPIARRSPSAPKRPSSTTSRAARRSGGTSSTKRAASRGGSAARSCGTVVVVKLKFSGLQPRVPPHDAARAGRRHRQHLRDGALASRARRARARRAS